MQRAVPVPQLRRPTIESLVRAEVLAAQQRRFQFVPVQLFGLGSRRPGDAEGHRDLVLRAGAQPVAEPRLRFSPKTAGLPADAGRLALAPVGVGSLAGLATGPPDCPRPCRRNRGARRSPATRPCSRNCRTMPSTRGSLLSNGAPACAEFVILVLPDLLWCPVRDTPGIRHARPDQDHQANCRPA